MGFDRRLQRYLRATAARGAKASRGNVHRADHPTIRCATSTTRSPTRAPAGPLTSPRWSSFEARERLPRWSTSRARRPRWPRLLGRALPLEARLDLMTCTPATLRRRRSRRASLRGRRRRRPRELVRGLLARSGLVRAGRPADRRHVARFSSSGSWPRSTASRGRRVFTAPDDGLSELAGIGTLPPFRRRGIAAAVTAALARRPRARRRVPSSRPGDVDTPACTRRRVRGDATLLAYARSPEVRVHKASGWRQISPAPDGSSPTGFDPWREDVIHDRDAVRPAARRPERVLAAARAAGAFTVAAAPAWPTPLSPSGTPRGPGEVRAQRPRHGDPQGRHGFVPLYGAPRGARRLLLLLASIHKQEPPSHARRALPRPELAEVLRRADAVNVTNARLDVAPVRHAHTLAPRRRLPHHAPPPIGYDDLRRVCRRRAHCRPTRDHSARRRHAWRAAYLSTAG